MRYTTENLAGAAAPAAVRDLPFAIGNHLSLRFPFRGPAVPGWDTGVLHASTTDQLRLAPGSLLSGEVVDRAAELGAGRAGMRLHADGATDGVFGLPATDAAGESRPCWMTLTQPGVLAVRVSHSLEKPSRRPSGEADRGGAASSSGAAPAPPGGPWNEEAWADAHAHRLFVLWGLPPPPPPALPSWAAVPDGEPGFLCVEPWQSGPDSLNTGAGLVVLGPGQHADWTFRVQVTALGH